MHFATTSKHGIVLADEVNGAVNIGPDPAKVRGIGLTKKRKI